MSENTNITIDALRLAGWTCTDPWSQEYKKSFTRRTVKWSPRSGATVDFVPQPNVTTMAALEALGQAEEAQP